MAGKGNKPWGCPLGHTGPEPATPPPSPRRAAGPPPAPSPQTATLEEIPVPPVSSRTSRVLQGLRKAGTSLAPAQGPSQSHVGPLPSSPPPPTRTRRAAPVDYAGMDEDEAGNLTDSDDEYNYADEYKSEEEEEFEEEENVKGEAEDEVEDEEGEAEAGAGKAKKWKDWLDKTTIPENFCRDGDSPEFEEELKFALQQLSQEIGQRKELRGQVYSGKYTPNQADMEMIDEFLSKPVMMQGHKWRKCGKKQKDSIKAIVAAGKAPTSKHHPAWQAVAYTVVAYKVGHIH